MLKMLIARREILAMLLAKTVIEDANLSWRKFEANSNLQRNLPINQIFFLAVGQNFFRDKTRVIMIFLRLLLKVAFFRKYDAFFLLPKKCAENYPKKEILKLCSV